MSSEPRTLAIQAANGRTIEAPHRTLIDDFARRGTLALLRKISRGSLCVMDGDERFAFGRQGDDVTTTVTIHDPGVYRAVLLGGSVGAAEAYMRGQWTSSDLASLTRILARNLDAFDSLDGGAARLSRRVARAIAAAGRRNTRAGSRRNIARHYDLSNELFALFLDDSMTYSSAILERDDASLGDAQIAKIDRVCQRLELTPADHLLEIGTGWGGLAIRAAREYGCRITTATISKEQHRLATERVRAAGLQDKVDVVLRDYRDLGGQYDKLVSIEMIEAVGDEYMDEFFRACCERLQPRGMMLLQAITVPDRRYDLHRTSADFIKEYIFPGSCIPSVTSLLTSATRVTDFRLSNSRI